MSVWNWVEAFRENCLECGDFERFQMANANSDAFPLFETDPDQALVLQRAGQQQAVALGEPRWVLFYEHWQLQVLLYHKFDYRQALDRAVKACVEVARPEFNGFPQRICLHEDLLNAYTSIDPIGHEDKIEAALAFMEREVTPDLECRHCVSGCRATFEMDRANYPAARAEAERGLDLADEDDSGFYQAGALSRLCRLAIHEEDWQGLLGLGAAEEEAARRSDRKQLIAHGILCQALAARCLVDAQRAQYLQRQAMGRMRRLAPPGAFWFDTLAEYHQRGGQLQKALAVRDQELAAIQNQGALDRECRLLIHRCRLLQQLGEIQAADLEAARQAARQLRKPERFLAEIDEIATV